MEFKEILYNIEKKSIPNLVDLYSKEIRSIISEIKKHIIYICGNNFFYFENGQNIFQTTCVTGEKGFGCEYGSFKTPTGLHFISDFIGDNCDKYQKFVNRLPTEIVSKLNFGEKNPGVYTRILRLDGIEEKNKNTLQRNIYIHGNIHDWYWEENNLKRSKGCIGLKVDEMVELFDMIKSFKDRVFVYIEAN